MQNFILHSNKLKSLINTSLIVVIFLFPQAVHSQMSEIKLHVVDSLNKEPIPFANLYIENTFSGTSSNENGLVVIKNLHLKYNEFYASAIGYNTKILKFKQFSNSDTIYLIAKDYTLNEFSKISEKLHKNPYYILRKALKNIPKNYPNTPCQINAKFINTFQNYDNYSLESNSIKQVEFGYGVNQDTTGGRKIKQEILKKSSSTWAKFRYNKYAFLPQYHIPDYNNNHVEFLLNMDPIMNNERYTFGWVDRFKKDFIKNHSERFIRLDSIGLYNGKTSYFLGVPRSRKMLEQMEIIHSKKYKPSTAGISIYNNHNYGLPTSTNIAKIVINADDFAIVFMDYFNGYFNDRYKFTCEYIKINDKYFPSKLYFGNKFYLSNYPNYGVAGEKPDKGIWCENGDDYYERQINKLGDDIKSHKNSKLFEEIAFNNTIRVNIKNNVITHPFADDYVNIIGRSRLIEQLRDSLDLKNYSKYFHHRLLRVESVNHESLEETKYLSNYTDFDRLFYYLGDINFHWYSYACFHPDKFKIEYKRELKLRNTPLYNIGRNRSIFAGEQEWTRYFLPFPITSDDELKYLFPFPNKPHKYNNPHLIKGYLEYN